MSDTVPEVKVIYGLMQDKMVNGTRVVCMRPVAEGGEEGVCAGCGCSLRFSTTGNGSGELIAVACSDKCAHDAGFYKTAALERPKAEPTAEETAPTQAEPVVETPAAPKVKRGPCPVCGGPVYKRGWKHTDTCTMATGNKKPKANKGPCPVCGGPASKRGWSHTPGCSNSGLARAQAKVKTAKPTVAKTEAEPVVAEATVTA